MIMKEKRNDYVDNYNNIGVKETLNILTKSMP